MVGVLGIRGVELAWERAGAGPVFVWGHGLTSSRADEDHLGMVDFAVLAKSVDVVRYDARGHGASGFTDATEPYGWGQMALDQLALADELGVIDYVAGGASLGAATALHAAVVAPERIRALVLVIPPTAWETRAVQVDVYAQMAGIIEAKGVKALLAAPPLPPPAPLVGRDDWAARRTTRLQGADPIRLAGLFRGAGIADFPSREQVASIAAPTLILAWEGDPGHPVSTADELATIMPNATRHIATTWDDFAQWTTMVQEFVAAL